MRKKLTVLVLVGLALVLLAGPALAAGSSRVTYASNKKTTPPRAHIISLSGTVMSIEQVADPSWIMVDVGMTNKAFRSFRGRTVKVYRANSTTYRWLGKGSTKIKIAFSTIAVGEFVCVNGLVKSDYVINAKRIDVDKIRKR